MGTTATATDTVEGHAPSTAVGVHTLQAGSRVELTGLATSHLNGETGVIAGPQRASGRWPVLLDSPAVSTGKPMGYKEENLAVNASPFHSIVSLGSVLEAEAVQEHMAETGVELEAEGVQEHMAETGVDFKAGDRVFACFTEFSDSSNAFRDEWYRLLDPYTYEPFEALATVSQVNDDVGMTVTYDRYPLRLPAFTRQRLEDADGVTVLAKTSTYVQHRTFAVGDGVLVTIHDPDRPPGVQIGGIVTRLPTGPTGAVVCTAPYMHGVQEEVGEEGDGFLHPADLLVVIKRASGARVSYAQMCAHAKDNIDPDYEVSDDEDETEGSKGQNSTSSEGSKGQNTTSSEGSKGQNTTSSEGSKGQNTAASEGSKGQNTAASEQPALPQAVRSSPAEPVVQPGQQLLHTSSRVELMGLGNKDLNGQRGTIEGSFITGRGRWSVVLDATDRKVSIKPTNLIRLASCSHCSAERGSKELKKCGKCHAVQYCNSDCQRKHWTRGRHKQVCSKKPVKPAWKCKPGGFEKLYELGTCTPLSPNMYPFEPACYVL